MSKIKTTSVFCMLVSWSEIFGFENKRDQRWVKQE